MPRMFAVVGSLILSISLIQLANGYIGTLIGIRLALEHVEPVVAGVVTSGYFAAYATGAFFCHRLIDRIGHIRSFTAFAALVAVTRHLRLTFLAPDIVQAILDGRHPPTLTAARLIRDTRLPLAWPDQRTALGFA